MSRRTRREFVTQAVVGAAAIGSASPAFMGTAQAQDPDRSPQANVRGTLPARGGYSEMFVDDGDLNMAEVLRTLVQVGYDGVIDYDALSEAKGRTMNGPASTVATPTSIHPFIQWETAPDLSAKPQ